jgi:tetratricopeptide (TPR) repeat protein
MEAIASGASWFDLGCELQNADRHQEALSAFEQALAIDPGIPYLKNRIAVSHSCLKQYAKSLDIFEALVRENPGDLCAWIGISFNAYRYRVVHELFRNLQRTGSDASPGTDSFDTRYYGVSASPFYGTRPD